MSIFFSFNYHDLHCNIMSFCVYYVLKKTILIEHICACMYLLAVLCFKIFHYIQGKSFGRTNGPGTYADDTDRGIVYDARDLSSTDVVAFNIFVLLYVVFNFTVAILIIPAAPIELRTFLKQIQRREYIKPYIKSLFWSAVFTGALYITSYKDSYLY